MRANNTSFRPDDFFQVVVLHSVAEDWEFFNSFQSTYLSIRNFFIYRDKLPLVSIFYSNILQFPPATSVPILNNGLCFIYCLYSYLPRMVSGFCLLGIKKIKSEMDFSELIRVVFWKKNNMTPWITINIIINI